MNPSSFYQKPDKNVLVAEFVGKSIDELPTPSVIIDRQKFIKNSRAMLNSASRLNANFRCHIKTHKTLEGVNLQLGYDMSTESVTDGVNSPTTLRIIVSTLAEAWDIIPLAKEGKITEVLFGLPIAKLKIGELHELSQNVQNVRVMVDSESQIDALFEFAEAYELGHVKWSVFIKIDMGYSRAGICDGTPKYNALLQKLLDPAVQSHVSLYGLYCHAGNSYGAKGASEAEEYLFAEIKHVNAAAKQARALNSQWDLQLSVGATPTAHVSSRLNLIADLETVIGEPLSGTLELHAGNYSCCDLQQVATGLVHEEQVSFFLLAEAITQYEERGGQSPGEQLINAGAIALSREVGPLPGYGKVVHPSKYGPWIVGKVSQEHGILYPQENCEFIPYGEKIVILPQHACITAAAHAWYFVVENDRVVDVWVPAKLW